jgi:hypothetical protein
VIGLDLEERRFPHACAQHVVKFLERGANNLSPRRFGIAGLTQKVNEAVDPLGIVGIEANGSNPMPRTWIGRVR